MRIFLQVLILISSFQFSTNADDISDFEIEGMSIRDSLLDYLSKNEINNYQMDYYFDTEFVAVRIPSKFIETYDKLDVHYKVDSNYIIHSIDGIIEEENIKKCKNIINNIDVEFSQIFKNSKKGEWKKQIMYSKVGYLHGYYFLLDSGDWSELSCYEFKKDLGTNHGRVSVYTKEFDEWLKNVKHK